MVYTIQASDDLLGKEQLKKILDRDDIQSDLMNTVEFDCTQVEIEQILDYCFTMPFFATHKIAILKNPVFLTGQQTRKDYTDFVEKLMNYVNNENKSTILIIYSIYESLDTRKKIVKFLKDKTQFIELKTPNPIQLNDMVRKMIEKNGNTISNNALSALFEKVGTNLVEIRTEVEKLTTFKPNSNIEIEDIEDFVAYNIDASIFDLSNAILARNAPKSITLLDDLIKNGLEPIQLVVVLANQLRTALLTKSYQKMQLSNDEIAQKLSKHPYSIKLAAQLTFSDKALKELLLKLANLDLDIKTGKVNKHHGLKVLILGL
jgi:DNA polymerase-3 subunit delta